MGIKIEKLDYVYMQGSPFERKALDNINLEINDGEFSGLIGHTGSGKSTLVQHLNGLLKPHGGSVVVNGRETTTKGEDLKKLRCEVGLVFQYPEHQLFEETVYKDIAFGPANLGLSKEEIDHRVKEAMNYVGLSYDLMEKSLSLIHISGCVSKQCFGQAVWLTGAVFAVFAKQAIWPF